MPMAIFNMWNHQRVIWSIVMPTSLGSPLHDSTADQRSQHFSGFRSWASWNVCFDCFANHWRMPISLEIFQTFIIWWFRDLWWCRILYSIWVFYIWKCLYKPEFSRYFSDETQIYKINPMKPIVILCYLTKPWYPAVPHNGISHIGMIVPKTGRHSKYQTVWTHQRMGTVKSTWFCCLVCHVFRQEFASQQVTVLHASKLIKCV